MSGEPRRGGYGHRRFAALCFARCPSARVIVLYDSLARDSALIIRAARGGTTAAQTIQRPPSYFALQLMQRTQSNTARTLQGCGRNASPTATPAAAWAFLDVLSPLVACASRPRLSTRGHLSERRLYCTQYWRCTPYAHPCSRRTRAHTNKTIKDINKHINSLYSHLCVSVWRVGEGVLSLSAQASTHRHRYGVPPPS